VGSIFTSHQSNLSHILFYYFLKFKLINALSMKNIYCKFFYSILLCLVFQQINAKDLSLSFDDKVKDAEKNKNNPTSANNSKIIDSPKFITGVPSKPKPKSPLSITRQFDQKKSKRTPADYQLLKNKSVIPLTSSEKPLLGPDLFLFSISSEKKEVRVGEEFELSVKVDWADFGVNNGVSFLPEWYKYTLKVVFPEGFKQTGGDYEDFCTKLVDANNTQATFTIKGKFEQIPKDNTFKILRGFEGANEKSEFIWKNDFRVNVIGSENLKSAKVMCPANWVSLQNFRCLNNNYEEEFLDLSACSPTYNTRKWEVKTFNTCLCKPTSGKLAPVVPSQYRCSGNIKQIASIDTNSCSATFGNLFWNDYEYNSCSCGSTASLSIPQTAGVSRCGAGTVTLNATCVTGFPNWYSSINGGIAIATNSVFTTPNLTATTTYYVTCRDASGACETVPRTPVVATIGTSLSVIASASSQVITSGQPVTLAATDISGASYSWVGPNGYNSTQRSPTISNFSSNNVGLYAVTASANNCLATSTIALSLATTTTTSCSFSVPSTTISVCQSNDLKLSVTGGNNYSWTGPFGFVETTQNPVIYATRKIYHEGIYTVVVTQTGANSCQSVLTVNVQIITNGSDPYIRENYSTNTANPSVCGDPLSLTGAGCPPGSTFKWFDISEENIGNQNTVIGTTTILVTPAQWTNPKYKFECVVQNNTSPCPLVAIGTFQSKKKPEVKIKSIIQPCEMSESSSLGGKVFFEVLYSSEANSLAYVLVDEGTAIPDVSNWSSVASVLKGRNACPNTNYSCPYQYVWDMGVVLDLVRPPYATNYSQVPWAYYSYNLTTNGNIKSVSIPSKSGRYKLVAVNFRIRCVSVSEPFEVYVPNAAVISSPITENIVANCFNDKSTAILNISTNSDLTGTVFSGNKELLTKIKPENIFLIDSKGGKVEGVTATAMQSVALKDYKLTLSNVPATVTTEKYTEVCDQTKPTYNLASCNQLPRHKIRFTAGDGCRYDSPPFAIKQPSELELLTRPSDPACFGEKLPSVALTAKGGSTGKEFFITNNGVDTKIGDADVNGKYTALASQYGNTLPYTFKVKDSKNCSLSAIVDASPVKAFVSSATVFTDNPDVVSLAFQGGIQPYQYAIVPESQTTAPSASQWTTIALSLNYVEGDIVKSELLVPGKYKVYTKYGTCATVSPFTLVTIGTQSIAELPTVPKNAICASTLQNVQDQVKCNQLLCEVKWYSAATGGTALDLATIVSSNAGTGKKDFYVASSIQGTTTETARVKASLLFIPKPTVTLSTLSICEGTPISLGAASTNSVLSGLGLTGTVTLQVTTPSPDNKTYDGTNYKPRLSGTYTVSQDYKESVQSLPCPSAGETVTLNVTPAPPTPILSQKEFIYCLAGTATPIAPTKSKVENGIQWELPAKLIANTYTPTTELAVVGSKTAQVYELAYKSASPLTEANACKSVLPLTITFTTVASLPAPTIKAGSVTCASGKVSLEAAGCETNMTYAWLSNTGVAGAFVNISGATTATYLGSSGVKYKAKCVSGTCEGTPSTEIDVIPSLATFNVKIKANTPISEYQTLELNATSSTLASYTWTGPNSFTSTQQNPYIQDLTSIATGTYTVVATEGTCTANATIAVSVNQSVNCDIGIKSMNGTVESYKFPSVKSPSAATTALTLSIIDNGTTPYWNVSPATYAWKGPDGFTSSLSTINTTKKGDYSLVITREGKQCESRVTLNGSVCGEVQPYVCSPNTLATPPTGVTPLKVLRAGDEIFAGDFKARIISSSGNGTFTGTAAVKIPYLLNAELLANFNNIQLNDCYELQKGTANKLVTVYNPKGGFLLDVDEVIDVVKEIADALNTLIQTSINKDYREIKAFEEAMKKYVRENLPPQLADDYNKALEELDAAKRKYDLCAKASPQDKACMNEADKEFKVAQAKIKGLKNDEEQLVSKVSDIIILAVNKIGVESNTQKPAKVIAYNSAQVALDAKSSPRSSNNNEINNLMFFIEDNDESAVVEAKDAVLKDYVLKMDDFTNKEVDVQLQEFGITIFNNFSTKNKTKLMGTAIKDGTNGKSLIYGIADKLLRGEAEVTIIEYTKNELKKFLLKIVINKN
jgi:Ig-like domain CHU_C associated